MVVSLSAFAAGEEEEEEEEEGDDEEEEEDDEEEEEEDDDDDTAAAAPCAKRAVTNSRHVKYDEADDVDDEDDEDDDDRDISCMCGERDGGGGGEKRWMNGRHKDTATAKGMGQRWAGKVAREKVCACECLKKRESFRAKPRSRNPECGMRNGCKFKL